MLRSVIDILEVVNSDLAGSVFIKDVEGLVNKASSETVHFTACDAEELLIVDLTAAVLVNELEHLFEFVLFEAHIPLFHCFFEFTEIQSS